MPSIMLFIGGRYITNNLINSYFRLFLYNGIPVTYSKNAKNLGLLINSNLSWDASIYIAEISRRIYSSFQFLKRLQKFLLLETKVTLAQSLLPDYVVVCFYAKEQLLNKLERLRNLSICLIFGQIEVDANSVATTLSYPFFSLLYLNFPLYLHNPNSPL